MSSVPPPAYVHPGPPPELPERPEGLPPLRSRADRWKPTSALLVFAAAFAVPIVLGLFAGIGVAAAGGDVKDMPSGVLIALTYGQDIGFILVPLALATWLVARPAAEDFGLRLPTQRWRAVGLLVAVYVGFVTFSAIWVQALNINERDSLPDDLGVNDSAVNLVLVLLLVTVLAPLAEEVLFRGYIFRALRNWQRGGVAFAAIASGVVFGGIHAGSSPIGFLVPLMAFGVGLALLYHWTGSLYAPVALHALNNALAFGATQDWDWQYAITIPLALVLSLLGVRLLGWRLGDGGPVKPSIALRAGGPAI